MIDLTRYASDQAFAATMFVISGCQVFGLVSRMSQRQPCRS
jgi:hypothetical protein